MAFGDVVIEIKIRDINSTDFNSAIIDEFKFNYLLNSKKRAYYICFYNDKKTAIWTINEDLPHQVVTKTIYNKGKECFQTKPLVYLRLSDAMILDF